MTKSRFEIWTLVERMINRPIVLDEKMAMVSFTFDDAPLSAFTNGGKILEEHGCRGTYYISSGLIGTSNETGDIAGLKTITEFHSRGHEIANHTEFHVKCRDFSPFRMARSIRQNKRKLAGIMSDNFSYPYGSVDTASRCVTRLCTSSARGVGHGMNRNFLDLAYLNAARVYNRYGIEKCLDLIEKCSLQGGWLIFYTHDVSDEPSDYGCTPGQLMELLQSVSSKGLPVLTVQEAMNTILE